MLVAELRAARRATVDRGAASTRRGGSTREPARLRDALAAGTVDAVTFTSSSTARNFAELFTDDERRALARRA